MRRLVWFSCGAASAVAAKLAVAKYGSGCEILYCDTMNTEHPDNQRFFDDVQRWLEVPIRKLSSQIYKDINEVFMRNRYLSGPKGAKCTVEMKKVPRVAYQTPDDIHIFGYTMGEERRAERFEDQNKALKVEWILIDEEISKQECLTRIEMAGIALPKMYELDFEHNNCLGCVKSASPGYWNRTRRLFPEVFALRCKQSRFLKVRLVKVNVSVGEKIADAKPMRRNGKIVGYRIFLDTLPPDADAPDDDIDCGPVCQVQEDEEEDSLDAVLFG